MNALLLLVDLYIGALSWLTRGGPMRLFRFVVVCGLYGHDLGIQAPGYAAPWFRVCRRCDGVYDERD